MIYPDLTKKALRLCFDAHKDQTDKSGIPYVFHPFHLAEQMNTEETVTVALLHDVVEDTKYTMEDIRRIGVPDTVLSALRLMTHDDCVPYMEYVVKLKHDPIARIVKLADLRHNSDASRLLQVTENDMKRILKYKIAAAILEDDVFDNSMRYYRKYIPLDFEGLRFLSLFYNTEKILKYSLDIEEGNASRCEFSASDGEKLRKYLDASVSLPEALANFILANNNSIWPEKLMRDAGVSFQSYHFDSYA
ncbi:MAG: hypothetical protein Q4C13_01025 [Clostridia bacterium]|nr:hypothetical protein [Clostridia bacterium]